MWSRVLVKILIRGCFDALFTGNPIAVAVAIIIGVAVILALVGGRKQVASGSAPVYGETRTGNLTAKPGQVDEPSH